MAAVSSLDYPLVAARPARLPTPQDEASPPGKSKGCSSVLDNFSVLCTNTQSLKAHSGELHARARLINATIIAVSESWMDQSVAYIPIPGYEVISRRDRSTNPNRGGIIVYALLTFNCVVLLEHSPVIECSWHIIHSNIGPLLFGLWYRSPSELDLTNVRIFQTEHQKYRVGTMGSILVGDMNIHHVNWLTFSRCNTPEGTSMMRYCHLNNLVQLVKEPTRHCKISNKDYLLDLVITDLKDYIKTSVGVELSDHKTVTCHISIPTPVPTVIPRYCWNFKKANWDALNAAFKRTNWDDVVDSLCANSTVTRVTQYILSVSKQHIPYGILAISKGTHAWMNKKCQDAVQKKCDAQNPEELKNAAIQCSKVLDVAYDKYRDNTKEELIKGSMAKKAWWKMSREVLLAKKTVTSIPPLKSGTLWVTTAKGKADLFAKTFAEKNVLAPQTTTPN